MECSFLKKLISSYGIVKRHGQLMEYGVWSYINAFYLLSLSLKMQKFCILERGRCKNSA